MVQAWAYSGGPPTRSGTGGSVTLVEGSTFCISDESGDLHPGTEQGLYFRDTRLISKFTLRIDGRAAEPVSTRVGDPFSCTFLARRRPRLGLADSTLLVVRERRLGDGLRETISMRNLGDEPTAVTLMLHVDADFADLFEVKESRVEPRVGITVTADDGDITFTLRQAHHSRGVSVSAPGALALDSGTLTWQVAVPAKGVWSTWVHVTPVVDEQPVPAHYHPGDPGRVAEPAARLAEWRSRTPRIATPDAALRRLVEVGVEDLGSLRIFDPEHPEQAVVAAGAPWFMTLFGRDSLLASTMLLPFDSSLAVGTLQTLARYQGKRVDALTEEEPGRILHEMRFGLDASLSLGGGNVYYGTADATPLFVMLMGEVRRWGAAKAQVDALLPHADAALRWIERYGDRDGDGFVEYVRATDRGLVNQGWKDSFDGVTFANGEIARPPIALAEVQGYVYAAYLARALLAREAGDDAADRHWTQRATRLKEAFNERFWLEEVGYYAVGLDAAKRPIDSLASNMGHCLWTGIVDANRAGAVADRLVGPEMFTGFGVRTLASSQTAYNPMSYHNGSVWPHDSAIAAAGLMRYGYVEHAHRVVQGLLDAGGHFGGRLPELFCGFDSSDFTFPVPYPTSCSPQAWAAAAPLLLLRTLLRIDPDVPAGRVWFAPAVPRHMQPLRLDGLRVAGAALSIEVDERGSSLLHLPPNLEVLPEPRPPAGAG